MALEQMEGFELAGRQVHILYLPLAVTGVYGMTLASCQHRTRERLYQGRVISGFSR